LVLCAVLGTALAWGCSGESDDSGEGGEAEKKPTVEKVDEVEPNDDPSGANAQDLGTFSKSKTIILSGELSSGGNNGQTYTGDWDIYTFQIGAIGSVSVSVEWDAEADLDALLLTEKAGILSADGEANKPAEVSKDPLYEGKYYLVLAAKDAGTPYEARIKYTKDPDPPQLPDCSPEPARPAMPSGGCIINTTTPACGVADLSSGGTFELAWTTNMTYCEGPHHVYIGGDPPSSWETGNVVSFDIASQDGSGAIPDERSGMTRNIGGYLNINQADLAGLSSESGIYYYLVASFHGSASEATPFIVR
jgi:hypothetical protein